MHLQGFPSERDFEKMLHSKIIVIFPVTFEYVKNAKLIFGPNVTSLKGKSVRRKPDSVITDYVETPQEILKSRKELEVSTEIILINKLSFLLSTIKGLKFNMIEYLSKKSEISLVQS